MRGSDRPRRGFGDGVGEKLGDAAIAPVVHVQPVGRDERFERNVLNFVPIAHDREAVEQVDVFLLGGHGDLIFHARAFPIWPSTLGTYCMSISTTSAPASLSCSMPSRSNTLMRLQRMIAHHRIGADLPEHQIGMRGDHIGFETRQHLRGLFAVDAAIEHGDVARRKPLLELRRQDGSDSSPPAKLAPAPEVEDEPMATMTNGAPLASRRAVRRQRMDETRELRGRVAGGRSQPPAARHGRSTARQLARPATSARAAGRHGQRRQREAARNDGTWELVIC